LLQELDYEYVKLFGEECSVERTPLGHDPANIIGLKVISAYLEHYLLA
jgi:hypothetical protein